MNKSMWTGQYSDLLVELKMDSPVDSSRIFVEAENKEQLVSYLQFAEKWKNVFLAVILSLGGIMAVLALVAAPWTIGVCLVLMSALMMILPFPTPQTVQLFGVRKSILLVRVVAVLIALAGIWIAFA